MMRLQFLPRSTLFCLDHLSHSFMIKSKKDVADEPYITEEGFSDDPCSNTYHGSSAASESETKAIQAELRMREANITAYVTVHATEQMILYPWGYTAKHEGFNCKRAKNHAKLVRPSQHVFLTLR